MLGRQAQPEESSADGMSKQRPGTQQQKARKKQSVQRGERHAIALKLEETLRNDNSHGTLALVTASMACRLQKDSQ